ncbi:MAG: hypothetical protein Q8R38_08560 [Candidatus Omnitrophota bacterium]|nr:hypothetical protein [Candidatus Omnitrophota bacterium]
MKKMLIISIILAISIIFVQGSYSAADDNSDRLSNGQSSVFSPGYINASKQKTDAIISQISSKKNLPNTSAEYMDTNLSDKVKEDAMDKPTLELKKKTGARGDSDGDAETASTSTEVAEAAVSYDVDIGSGTDQVYEDGRLISEVIDGQKYVYAGFDDVGKGAIQEAIDIAGEGDRVIVKGGIYDPAYYMYEWGNVADPLVIKNGVSLYGGYSESGERDLENTPTIINGFMYAENIDNLTEIDGFTFNVSSTSVYGEDGYAGIHIDRSSDLVISNNTFNAGDFTGYYGLSADSGIRVNGSSITLEDNDFNTGIGVSVTGIYQQYMFLSIPGSSMTVNTSGAMSTVISTDNNYNSVYGISLNGGLSLSSSGDYFASEADSRLLSYSYGSYTPAISMASTKTAPNLETGSSSLLANTSSVSTSNTLFLNNDRLDDNKLFLESVLYPGSIDSGKALGANGLASIFKGLLANKGALQRGSQGAVDPKLLAGIVDDALGRSALAVPQAGVSAQEMDIAAKLANILKNPTQDQRLMLDVMTALLNEVKRQEQESGSPELKKASDDLLQAVAAILIAQAIPDLLKDGDVSNVKNIFSELNTSKGKIILEYQESVKPYYDDMKKIISKNIALLQLNNILSKNMMEQELSKLEPNEVDKILDKIRRMEKKGFEEEYILQQEAKYRKQYIDPNKKLLEEKMKAMMGSFTKRLSKVLETVKSSQK